MVVGVPVTEICHNKIPIANTVKMTPAMMLIADDIRDFVILPCIIILLEFLVTVIAVCICSRSILYY